MAVECIKIPSNADESEMDPVRSVLRSLRMSPRLGRGTAAGLIVAFCMMVVGWVCGRDAFPKKKSASKKNMSCSCAHFRAKTAAQCSFVSPRSFYFDTHQEVYSPPRRYCFL